MPLPNNDNSQKAPHHHDANNPSTSPSKSPRQPTLTNPLVHFPIQTLFELPNLITDEEATRLIHALDKGHFGKEWTNEGFDRRHRVQRYHYRHSRHRRCCDSDAGSAATRTNENRLTNSADDEKEDQEEEHDPPPPSVEESFGWIFDRISSASRRDPIDIAVKDNEIENDAIEKDSATEIEQESRNELPTPMEVIVTEHTPTSCRSQVNIFEQNEYCTCWKDEKRQQHLQKQNSNQNEKDCQMEQRQQRKPLRPIPPKCTCYTAQLTLLSNAVQSIEKPMERTPSCWDVAEPSQLHETNVLMEQNGVVVKRGECLWEWRGRISDIGAVQERWNVDDDAESEGPSKNESVTDDNYLKKQESGVSVPGALGTMATLDDGEERKSKSAPSSGNGAWQRLKKLNSVNKRCITVTFRSIQNAQPEQPNGKGRESEKQQSQRQNEGEEGTKFEKPPHLPLSQLLTIIVTTSPIRSHPSTEMLEKTFDTFPYAGEEFAYECQKVIVCDGCRVRDEEEDGFNNSNGVNSRQISRDSATTSNSNQSFSNTNKNNNNNRNNNDKNNSNGINSGSNHSEPKPTITRKHANIKQALRSGIATVDQAKNYIEFKTALRKLCKDATRAPYPQVKSPFRNAEVVELEERHGYGFALRHALIHSIDTPYVCVIQHDRTFMRPTPVAEVVDAMRNDPMGKIKYVGMSMKSNLMYYDIFGGKYGKKAIDELRSMILRPESLCIGGGVYGPNGSSSRHMTADSKKVRKNLESLVETYRGSMQYITYKEWLQSVGRSTAAGTSGGRCGNFHQNCHQLSLTPTLFWYDNTHIVQTSHYRDFVFDPKYKMVARGGFVEDKLSPAMIRNVERFGLREGHERFGCYLLDDHSGMFFTGHLDGGGYLTADEKDKIQKSIGGKKDG